MQRFVSSFRLLVLLVLGLSLLELAACRPQAASTLTPTVAALAMAATAAVEAIPSDTTCSHRGARSRGHGHGDT